VETPGLFFCADGAHAQNVDQAAIITCLLERLLAAAGARSPARIRNAQADRGAFLSRTKRLAKDLGIEGQTESEAHALTHLKAQIGSRLR